ncbi:selenium metabolism-associated LysR family transcriptional regulator [Clostridium sp. Mt-5]|uniref:Selenium metabolism-associated LysR family transcriptional regulator n=1 Tax=Clostridium moutaii TaxID=3240932 RepID=A0ABV4BPU8_9CLOT
MDFKQIDAFINVAKFKSFSKAANSIFLSQPAISSHIATLEKELKVQLFDRTSKEVVLTPAGESFLKFAIEILNTRDKAIHTLVNFNETISGKLKLAASTTPCNAIVPSLIKKFHDIYPDVTFDVVELNSAQIIKNIIRFDYEIGLVGEQVNDEKIKSYKLAKDELVIISHPSLNIPDIIDIASLFKYNFVLREKGSATRKTFEDILQQNGYNISNINSYFEVNNLDTLVQFVKKGLGISVVSNQVFRDYISLGLIRESKLNNISLNRSIYLILSSKRTLTPTAKAFFNLCKKTFNIKED